MESGTLFQVKWFSSTVMMLVKFTTEHTEYKGGVEVLLYSLFYFGCRCGG
jgi:hypothetical protein